MKQGISMYSLVAKWLAQRNEPPAQKFKSRRRRPLFERLEERRMLALPPPMVTSVVPTADTGSVPSGTTYFTVNFSEPVQNHGTATNYVFRRAGTDGIFDTSDDTTFNPAEVATGASSALLFIGNFADGACRLTINPAIIDLGGNALDGNADGAAGGAYVREFVVGGNIKVWGDAAAIGAGPAFGDASTPTNTVGITDVVAIAEGYNHTLALKADGTVWSWGDGTSFGQLGNGSNSSRSLPGQIAGLSNVIAISAGGNNSLALLSDGTVRAWGDNSYGQIGDGTTTTRMTPVTVTNLTGVTAIANGAIFAMALRLDGTVWTWGYGADGALGSGSTSNRSTAAQVPSLTNVSAIAAGQSHALAVRSDGTARAWGRNNSGQLGDNSTTNRLSPVTVSGLSGVTKIAGGGFHSLAVRSSGTVSAWGDNSAGQLGDGTTTQRNTPVTVPNLFGITSVAAGNSHSLALNTNGTARAWGANSLGQLGDGTTTQRTSPVSVNNLSSAVAISASNYNSAALLRPRLGSNTTFNSTNIPVAMPTGGGNSLTFTSALTINTHGTIADLNARINVSHTWDQDLTISLISPQGTSVTLASGVGSSNDNFFDTVFDDEASTAISAGAAPFTGSFRPTSGLGAFDNQDIFGTWTLQIVDGFPAQDGGQLNSWSITPVTINSPVINAPATAAVTQGTPRVFSAANGNQISLTDNTAGIERVTLNAAGGTITLGSTTGLMFLAGADGYSAMTFQGSYRDVNAALNGMSFSATQDFVPGSLTITANNLDSPITSTRTINMPITYTTLGLFSESEYLRMYPDIAATVGPGKAFATGYQHYIQFGQFESRNPSSFFDERFYRANNPDLANVIGAGRTFASGYQHYLYYGQYEIGRSPNPLFSERFYLGNNPDIVSNVGRNRIFPSGFDHYLRFGQYERRNPSGIFDENYYIGANADLQASTGAGKTFQSGFEHFLLYGQYELRAPNLLFNAAFYLAANPDVASSVGPNNAVHSAFEHYFRFGQNERRNPYAAFNEANYLARYGDVASNVGPTRLYQSGFEHYLRFGRFEGRITT